MDYIRQTEQKGTDEHVEMMTKVNGQCGDLKQELRIVDVDSAILPDPIMVHVPQVYAVPTPVHTTDI